MSSAENEYAIGALARETGVKVPTIRFYESIGLMPKPQRTAGNRRLYGDDALRRLKFVRHARELGFEVSAIRELLGLADDPHRQCAQVDAIAREHLKDIDSRIERLQALRSEMGRMIAECGHGKVADCRILEVLGNHDFCVHHAH